MRLIIEQIEKYPFVNCYVKTMDLSIIQNKRLRRAFKMILNHIPLRSTVVHEVLQVIVDTFIQVWKMLNVENLLYMDVASKEVQSKNRSLIIEANKVNKFGFRYFQSQLFTEKVVNDKLN